jgi:hypothetical protein
VFDGAADHMFRVAVENGSTQFNKMLCGSALVKTVSLTEQFEQFTVRRRLRNDVHARLVVEIAIKPKDVGVAQT